MKQRLCAKIVWFGGPSSLFIIIFQRLCFSDFLAMPFITFKNLLVCQQKIAKLTMFRAYDFIVVTCKYKTLCVYYFPRKQCNVSIVQLFPADGIL